MSRLDENKKYKVLFKRQVCFIMTVFLFMFVSLVMVDYFFYKNVEGKEAVNIFNIINEKNQFDVILFGKEILSIPIK